MAEKVHLILVDGARTAQQSCSAADVESQQAVWHIVDTIRGRYGSACTADGQSFEQIWPDTGC